ncbi:transposase [Candidatus Palauibacter sp.]|uniref:transposase n=1 Tax=Candidatus Palauibacter sp. TaxID=3101350 RepID=UPI003B5B2AB6
MAGKRRRFTAEFKARVALEALRERDSVQAIARRHELHPNQVSTWKRQLLEGLPEVFAGGAGRKLAKEHCKEQMKLSGLVARNMSGLNIVPVEASVASRSGHDGPPHDDASLVPPEAASGRPRRS